MILIIQLGLMKLPQLFRDIKIKAVADISIAFILSHTDFLK